MPLRVVAALTAGLLLCNCAKSPPDDHSMDRSTRVLKVAVSRAGVITLDGSAVSVDQLRDRLAAASRSGCEVWYYRENGQGDPPEEAMLVMKAIADHRLPVSLSSTPDFSTVVLPRMAR
jgi:hypothetical protein